MTKVRSTTLKANNTENETIRKEVEIKVIYHQAYTLAYEMVAISDVILNLRYASVDDGNKLKKSATDFVHGYISIVTEINGKEGLFVVIDFAHDLPK